MLRTSLFLIPVFVFALSACGTDSGTSASDDDVAQIGHSDLTRPGLTIGGPDRLSWNSAHETTGCTQQGLAERQGAGRFYCFAAD